MLKDSDFVRGKVPMTKEEVRAVIMAKAALHEGSYVIDIGAGTGSLSIQAAIIAKNGKVFAIEHNPEAVALIKRNLEKHKVQNLQVIAQSAPESLIDLPQVQAIIVGGSSGKLREIIVAADQLLAAEGKLIVTSITLATLWESINYMSGLKYRLDISQIAITKYASVNGHLMAKAHNPIFIIAGEKGG